MKCGDLKEPSGVLQPSVKCVAGGDLAEGKVKCKVQDAYSMRSTPQVIGAAHDALELCTITG